jgi:hypothetical protein
MDSHEERRTRQRQLVELYAEFHLKKDKFGGDSLGIHIPAIGELIKETESKSVLDYGCGRAKHYTQDKLSEKWGVACSFYDPAVEEFKVKPERKFDGVICTDVLEHLLEPEVELEEIFGFAERFVFLSICCRPSNSNKKLSDGTEFHISVHHPDWWEERLKTYRAKIKTVVRYV